MNLLEALKTGKPLRRKTWKRSPAWPKGGHLALSSVVLIGNLVEKDAGAHVPVCSDDLLADDWEVKD